jgi:hypothetical protein
LAGSQKVNAVQCTNCQSGVPAGAVQCPVCQTTLLTARRILTGAPDAAAPASPPKRPRLVAAPSPGASGAGATTSARSGPAATATPSAHVGGGSGAPTNTVTGGPTLTAVAPVTQPSRASGLSVQITGHVSGAVAFGQRQVGSGAGYVLTVLAVFGAFVLGVVLLFHVLMVFVLPFIAVIVLISIVVNRSAGFDTMKSTLGFGLSGLGHAVPGRPSNPGPKSLDVTRFRVTDPSGAPYDCEILGELRAPPPKLNDDVEIVGRRRRDGVIQVRVLRNRVSGTTLRGRVPLSTTGSKIAPWVLGALVIALVLFLLGHGA